MRSPIVNNRILGTPMQQYSSVPNSITPIVKIIPVPVNFGNANNFSRDDFEKEYFKDQILKQNETIRFMMNQMERD